MSWINSLSSVLVYVADDDPLAVKRLAGALRAQTGYRVASFSNAEDLLAAVAKRVPDVVIADLRMPGTGGLELLDRLAAEHPDVLGIAMTTYGDVDSTSAALAAVGQLRVINKPCDLRDLELKVRAGLHLRDTARDLRAARAELDARRREATTATERLVEAEQLAAVGRVVSGIAHEIDEQLALVGYAEAIKSRVADDPELREFADVIVTAQKRLASMVDEIRDFVASDAKRGALAREPSELCGVVDEALAIVRYDKDVRARVIDRRFRARPLAALHRDKFRQVVINLVSNAALATQPGDAIAVEVSEDDTRGVAVVCVEDRGVGMPDEVLRRLGEPFFTTRGERGSGLGVGICRRIVEEHGGQLVFESAVGEGTRAVVTVPLLAFEEAAP